MAKINVIFSVEAVAISEEAVKKHLKTYVEKIGKEKYMSVEREDFSDVNEVNMPPNDKNIKTASHQSCEIEADFDTLKDLLFFTMTFGPTSIEVMGPRKMDIKQADIQEAVSGIAELMHRFAAQGAGGIVYSSK